VIVSYKYLVHVIFIPRVVPRSTNRWLRSISKHSLTPVQIALQTAIPRAVITCTITRTLGDHGAACGIQVVFQSLPTLAGTYRFLLA